MYLSLNVGSQRSFQIMNSLAFVPLGQHGKEMRKVFGIGEGTSGKSETFIGEPDKNWNVRGEGMTADDGLRNVTQGGGFPFMVQAERARLR